MYTVVGKRFLDLTFSACAFVVLAPLMVVVALIVRLDLGPGVLYRQLRIGRDGDPFEMYKFRTMRPDRRWSTGIAVVVGVERRKTHKSPSDPRHTGIGRMLRRTSLDELPQLLNVLKGNMSLVGPRPELPNVVHGYESWEHARHTVRPGLTGPWQISARNFNNGCDMHRYIDLDLRYVANVTLWRDARILAATAVGIAFLKFKGA